MPKFPRSEWSAHPNFPEQSLLLRSHEDFRRLARRLSALDPLERIERLFRRGMFAMESHERYEESKLYPYLERRWGVSMDALVAGHESLTLRKRELSIAFVAARERSARSRLEAAIAAFGETLREHLDLEEETVIPLLLELSPDEFADYSLLPIAALLSGE